jgi:hypothetical protein
MKNTCTLCGAKRAWPAQATAMELQSGLCGDCWGKPFPIASIARADLAERFAPEQVAQFTDADMVWIAARMANVYCENGFWDEMEIIGEILLEDTAG